MACLSVIAFLTGLALQTHALRDARVFRPSDAVTNEAMRIIDDADTEPISSVLSKLLTQCVILPHLTTTLRKMGAGQQCSLRFFPDGAVLRPTGVQTYPGRSLTRLANVLGIFSDLSVLKFENGEYLPGTVAFP
jgi:hypothetical protein